MLYYKLGHFMFDDHVVSVTGSHIKERTAANVRLIHVKMAACLTKQPVDVTVPRDLVN